MSTFVKTGLSACVIVALSGALATAPAQADAAAAEPCPDGKYCLYDGPDYTGLLVVSDKMLVPRMLPRNDNRVSSIINNADLNLHVFPDPGYNGSIDWKDFNGLVFSKSRVSLARPRANDNKVSSYYLY